MKLNKIKTETKKVGDCTFVSSVMHQTLDNISTIKSEYITE